MSLKTEDCLCHLVQGVEAIKTRRAARHFFTVKNVEMWDVTKVSAGSVPIKRSMGLNALNVEAGVIGKTLNST